MTERDDAVDLLHRAAECVAEGEYPRALANMQAAASLIQYEDATGMGRNSRMAPDTFDPGGDSKPPDDGRK